MCVCVLIQSSFIVIHVYRSEYLKEIYVCHCGSCAINCDNNNQRQVKFNLLVNLVVVSVITGERGQLLIGPERSTLGNLLNAYSLTLCRGGGDSSVVRAPDS